MAAENKRRRIQSTDRSEVLYGIHPVTEAIRAGRRRLYEIYLLEAERSERLASIATLAASRSIPIKRLDSDTLTQRCHSDRHQGAALRAGPFPCQMIEDLLRDVAAAASGTPFLLLLDNIQDPHNLGAILRTAACAGVDGIVVPKDRSAPPGPTVSRVSAGALEHATIYRVTNLADTIIRLQKQTRIWFVGLDPNAGKVLYNADLSGPLGLVVGGEGKGIRTLIRKRCDDLVSIPQVGAVDSLNASVAAAVGIYEAVRQRRLLPDG